MREGWHLFMKSNSIIKLGSLTLSSMIFSVLALHPVCAGRVRTKKAVFSDSTPLTKRLEEENQAMKPVKEKETAINLNDIFEPDKNLKEGISVSLVSPVAINKFEIYEKIENLEKEVYGKSIFTLRNSRCYEKVFHVEFCTDISFKGFKECSKLDSFKTCVRKFSNQQFDDEQFMPLNVSVYFYIMNFLQEIDEMVKCPKFCRDKLWQEHQMDDIIDRLQYRRENLGNLVRKGRKTLFFQFNCGVESVIEFLFRIRDFCERWAVENEASVEESGVKDIDTAIAMLWYIDQSIIM